MVPMVPIDAIHVCIICIVLACRKGVTALYHIFITCDMSELSKAPHEIYKNATLPFLSLSLSLSLLWRLQVSCSPTQFAFFPEKKLSSSLRIRAYKIGLAFHSKYRRRIYIHGIPYASKPLSYQIHLISSSFLCFALQSQI